MSNSTTDGLVPVALDTETFLIGPNAIAPKMVCVTADDGESLPLLLGNHPDDEAERFVRETFEDPKLLLVFHNAAYDLTVFARSYPALFRVICDALEAERVDDTLIREKLIHLSTHGRLSLMRLPGGQQSKIEYSLAALEAKYTGVDRAADKSGPDSWRLNYKQLDGWLGENYPDEAARYAKEDASGTLQVWWAQEGHCARSGATTQTSRFQVACDFALRMMTVQGVRTDQTKVKEIAATLETELAPAKFPLLIEAGILDPGSPERPHARGAKAHVGGCKGTSKNPCACPPKMTASSPPSIKTGPLKEHVRALCEKLGREPKMTDPSDANPEGQISTDGDHIGQLKAHSPILTEYDRRQEIVRLQSTYIPALLGNERVWPNYSVLVETSRTSSYGGSRGRPSLYPALNIQNQPKAIRGMDIRSCFLPEPNTVFWDVDYSTIELACVGQITKDLFGSSVHLSMYNAGVDLHSYLATTLVLRLGQCEITERFRKKLHDDRINDPVARQRIFVAARRAEEPALAKWAGHWRDFSKPVGLGFPGGLGAAKMVTFARATYDVIMTEDEARASKQGWLETYPEMPLYFKWVTEQVDPTNQGVWDEEDERPQDAFWYTTPLGMIRRGATYCATANGKAMQSPNAEGAKLATYYVVRECYDESLGSVLFGCRPFAFVHDQIIGSTTTEPEKWHDQCMRVSEVMIESMQVVLPDVKVRTEPLLTKVWSKSAKPTFDVNKKLIPWEPKV